jgi:hypothetical protein
MPNEDPRNSVTYDLRNCVTYACSNSSNTGNWTIADWNVYPGGVYIGDPMPMPSTTPWIQPVIQPYYPPWPPLPYVLTEDRKPKERLMKVFEVLVIDKRECKVLDQKTIVAQDRETAMLDLDLAPEVRAKVKKQEVEFIFTERGSFTKVERKIKIADLKDEE